MMGLSGFRACAPECKGPGRGWGEREAAVFPGGKVREVVGGEIYFASRVTRLRTDPKFHAMTTTQTSKATKAKAKGADGVRAIVVAEGCER